MPFSPPYSRRHFIKSLLATAGWAWASPVFSQSSQKLRIACIGVGGWGEWDVNGVSGEHLVAFCDVNETSAANMFKKFPTVPRFKDYRKMFEKMASQFDAVTITTPDHMHFPIAKMALEAGKHVFLQKPLTHTVSEARELLLLSESKKRVTQMGNQGHASDGIREAHEWVQSGVLGKIERVYSFTDRPLWKHSEAPSGKTPIPAGFDWNLWLGVAAQRPHHRTFWRNWRAWRDFGSGALGDLGPHILDMPVFALNLGAPSQIVAKTSHRFNDSFPQKAQVTFTFPATAQRNAVQLHWQDNNPSPTSIPGWEWLKFKNKNCSVLVGENGVLKTDEYSGQLEVVMKDKSRPTKKPKKLLERIPNNDHYQEWIRACKGEGPPPGSNFTYAAPLTEIALLGNIAMNTGEDLHWDALSGKFKNSEKANALLTKTYRAF